MDELQRLANEHVFTNELDERHVARLEQLAKYEQDSLPSKNAAPWYADADQLGALRKAWGVFVPLCSGAITELALRTQGYQHCLALLEFMQTPSQGVYVLAPLLLLCLFATAVSG